MRYRLFFVPALLVSCMRPAPEPTRPLTQGEIASPGPGALFKYREHDQERDGTCELGADAAAYKAAVAEPLVCWSAKTGWSKTGRECVEGIQTGANLVTAGGQAIGSSGRGVTCDQNGEALVGVGLVSKLRQETPQVHLTLGEGQHVACPAIDTKEETGLFTMPLSAQMLRGVPRACVKELEGKKLEDVGAKRSATMIEVDLDGDGKKERVLGVRVRTDACALGTLWVRWGGSWRLEIANHETEPERSRALGWGMIMEFGASCYDLNQDRRAEVLMSFGGETELSYEVIAWEGERFVVRGSGYSLGD